MKSLADQVNNFFISITERFSPLPPVLPPAEVPSEFFVSEREVYNSLSSLKIDKAIGPDELPNKLLKDFALELAPVVRDIYNQSMRESFVLELLKSSIVNPVPKVTPPQCIGRDLRPIFLTCTLAKVMEGFSCKRLLH